MAEKNISLANRAYTIIKENIMNLTYPPGMTLTEAKLTKELGMSRSPVRSAIQMLQNEGLIVSDYYKSMMVKEITDEDITEIYQIRELFEGAAFELIFTSGRYEEYSYRIEEKVVRMCAAAGDLYNWELADAAMHGRPASAPQHFSEYTCPPPASGRSGCGRSPCCGRPCRSEGIPCPTRRSDSVARSS